LEVPQSNVMLAAVYQLAVRLCHPEKPRQLHSSVSWCSDTICSCLKLAEHVQTDARVMLTAFSYISSLGVRHVCCCLVRTFSMLQLVQQPPIAGPAQDLHDLQDALFQKQQLAPVLTVFGKLAVHVAAGTGSCLHRQACRLSRAMQHASGSASKRLMP